MFEPPLIKRERLRCVIFGQINKTACTSMSKYILKKLRENLIFQDEMQHVSSYFFFIVMQTLKKLRTRQEQNRLGLFMNRKLHRLNIINS